MNADFFFVDRVLSCKIDARHRLPIYVHQWFLEFELVIISSSANPSFPVCREISMELTLTPQGFVRRSPSKHPCQYVTKRYMFRARACICTSQQRNGRRRYTRPCLEQGTASAIRFPVSSPFAAACGGPIFDTSPRPCRRPSWWCVGRGSWFGLPGQKIPVTGLVNSASHSS